MISLRLNQQAEALRSDFIKWLSANPPPQIAKKVELAKFVEVSRSWQSRLAAERWIAVHWPESFGGRGLSILAEAVIQECLAEANSPQLINLFGLTMVGPVLIKHGTPTQQERYLKKILSAEEIWCQGFSEPEAGSDLAAVRTKAETVTSPQGGTFWEINGQKVWTSFAQYADWCFVLARSDEQASRYEGLSYLLVPMSSSGITIRELTQISGDKEFNELFFDKVQVPEENIVGKAGDGWKIAISTLMYERVILTFARHLQSEAALKEAKALLSSRESTQLERVNFGRLLAKSMAVRTLALSHLLQYEGSVSPGPEGSLDKLGWSETYQEICKYSMDLLGPEAVLESGSLSYKEGMLQHSYLYSRGRTIAAGTSEIQRNIIAERLLGLPREAKG